MKRQASALLIFGLLVFVTPQLVPISPVITHDIEENSEKSGKNQEHQYEDNLLMALGESDDVTDEDVQRTMEDYQMNPEMVQLLRELNTGQQELPAADGDSESDGEEPKFVFNEERWNLLQEVMAGMDSMARPPDDVERIKENLNFLQSEESNVTDIETSLQNLEDLCHQIDNARDFVTLGGLTVILPLLHDTRSDISWKAAWLLGTASQNNPAVTVAATEKNAVEELLTALQNSIKTVDVTSSSKFLYALSALIRTDTAAQVQFLLSGGVDTLKSVASLHTSEGTSIENEPHINRVKGKALSLADDIIQMKDAEKGTAVYVLQQQLSDKEWCELFSSSLTSESSFDIKERVLRIADELSSRNLCLTQFGQDNVLETLSRIRGTLDESYDMELINIVDSIINKNE